MKTHLNVGLYHFERVGKEPDPVADEEHEHDVQGDPRENDFSPPQAVRLLRPRPRGPSPATAHSQPGTPLRAVLRDVRRRPAVSAATAAIGTLAVPGAAAAIGVVTPLTVRLREAFLPELPCGVVQRVVGSLLVVDEVGGRGRCSLPVALEADVARVERGPPVGGTGYGFAVCVAESETEVAIQL